MRAPARLALMLALVCGPGAAQAAPAPEAGLELAWREGGTVHYRALDRAGQPVAEARPPAKLPLGSLWKLFVYSYLVARQQDAPPYACQGLQREEVYCCDAGDSIERDAALVRSCGLFFAPDRLGLKAADWAAFWRARPGAPAWLTRLGEMRPEREVGLAELFDALDAVPPQARATASGVLLARVMPGYQPGDAVRYLGGRLRIKSFSWHRPGQPAARLGGGAGWLADGRPVWFAAPGTSDQVLARDAAALGRLLPPPGSTDTPSCVVVRYFTRYPLTGVEAPGGRPAAPGPLRGHHVARFANGVSLPFLADGAMLLERDTAGQPHLIGRMSLEGYVARVLDREGDPGETQAARALAVTARSYLLGEAGRAGDCLAIDDASRTQRVSPNPPSAAARAVAAFTAGIVLRDTPVSYHLDHAAPGRLGWRDAVARSRAGQPWDAILAQAFPDGSLAGMADPAGQSCTPLPAAQSWLAGRIHAWRRRLDRLPGYEAPPETPQVCRLRQGNPYSEPARNRIHVRGIDDSEDRIALAHEFLHLALSHHPSGQDEALVEQWARRIALEVAP